MYSPASGLTVRLKLEDSADSTKTIETDATTTVANGWQTLTFDFNTVATGTAAFNDANNYNKASIFLDFLTTQKSVARTFYVDDISYNRVTSSGATAATITFDETAATPVVSTDTITNTDFGGNVSSIVSTDIPAATGAIGSSGKALKVEQAMAGNEGWSGVTVATLASGAEFINTANKTITAKVYSPG